MRRILAATAASFLVTALVTAFAADASANATLNGNLGGPRGYGAMGNCVPPNDDGSWPPPGAPGLDITAAFPNGLQFFNGTYRNAWINNNGNMTFAGALSTYSPNAFPVASEPMIAPYWADVDTRGSTYCSYGSGLGTSGQGYPVGDTCKNPASNGVWWDIRPGQMTVTWDQVGYYSCLTDKIMSFQMILSANSCGGVGGGDGGTTGTNFDIEFRYNTCGWEAGNASGGSGGFCMGSPPVCVPAQAGFDAGDQRNYAALPMSLRYGISTELCTGSNLTPPQSGVWRFAVRGGQISCPNAGKPCTVTGAKGICAQGQIQCPGTSGETCVATNMPQPTKCNGLDNNCDGVIDTTCPANEVCVGAACVPACIEGGCPSGTTCTSTTNGKVCVETACIGVTCPTGQRCKGGQCIDDCSGVVCPIGQVCRVGACVDPCAGLNCGMGQVCENGVCLPTCPCRACNANQTCEMNGACVATPCANKTCAAGQVCQVQGGTDAGGGTGACVDACTGAICPDGQTCKTGKCVALPPVADAGSDSGIIVPPMDTDGGSIVDAGDDGGGPNGFSEAGTKSGCGCRAASGDDNALAIAVGVGLAAIFVGRRKRSK